MGDVIKLTTPITTQAAKKLRAGDRVCLSGSLFTARDMAHRRLCEAIKSGKEIPFDPRGSVIYYVGPTPARPGMAIGAAGPTTSSRMDRFSPYLYARGVKATIGKGYRSEDVQKSLKKNGAVHLSATGGAGALLSKHIVSVEVVAYDDLGTEAVRELEVVDFPAVVAYDAHGRSVYDIDKDAKG